MASFVCKPTVPSREMFFICRRRKYWEDKSIMVSGCLITLNATRGENLWGSPKACILKSPPEWWIGRLFSIKFWDMSRFLNVTINREMWLITILALCLPSFLMFFFGISFLWLICISLSNHGNEGRILISWKRRPLLKRILLYISYCILMRYLPCANNGKH